MAWTTPKTWSAAATLTAAELNTHVRDNLNALAPDGDTSASWTPGLFTTDDVAVSLTSTTGREYRLGPLQFAWVRWVIDASVIGSGSLYVALPAAISGITSQVNSGQAIGTFQLFDSSNTLQSITGTVIASGASQARFYIFDGGTATDSTPFALGSDDVLSMHVCYPVA